MSGHDIRAHVITNKNSSVLDSKDLFRGVDDGDGAKKLKAQFDSGQ